ncbi:MAG: hypothetical protein R3A10_11835 [Caldilineaceae bacterium]
MHVVAGDTDVTLDGIVLGMDETRAGKRTAATGWPSPTAPWPRHRATGVGSSAAFTRP